MPSNNHCLSLGGDTIQRSYLIFQGHMFRYVFCHSGAQNSQLSFRQNIYIVQER